MSTIIRKLQPSNLEAVLRLARLEGWPENIHTLRASFNLGPGHWLEASVDGKLAGCVGFSKPTNGIGTSGYMLMDPGYRGNKVAAQLLRESIGSVGDMNYQGNSISNMTETYRKFIRNMVTSFTFQNMMLYPKHKITAADMNRCVGTTDIVPYEEKQHLGALVEFDSDIHVIKRMEYLRTWCSLDSFTKTYLALNGSKVIGYGCLNHLYDETYRIGPLFADSVEVARGIYHILLSHVPHTASTMVVIGMTEPAHAEPLLTEKLGIIQRRYHTKLFFQKEIKTDQSKVYAMSDIAMSFV